MNVEYRCGVCGHKMFAPPNRTNIMCPNQGQHSNPAVEGKMTQFENYTGVIDLSQGTTIDNSGNSRPNPGALQWGADAGIEPVQESEEDHLRRVYQALANQKPDGRWGAQRLREEIDAVMAANTPDSADPAFQAQKRNEQEAKEIAAKRWDQGMTQNPARDQRLTEEEAIEKGTNVPGIEQIEKTGNEPTTHLEAQAIADDLNGKMPDADEYEAQNYTGQGSDKDGDTDDDA